ncbi:MAG TPA: fumarylacetoacetate hydrolase family protein [Beijerinckiaceae bacterium]|jgi:2-keto-4-pentenoate hydratase/2-oxohepta-3-ene-1,7-dioic acid hydratase in catechol pathway
MKLLRYGQPGAEKPGLLDAEGRIRDLSAHTADFAGETVSIKAIDKLRALDAATLPLVDGSPRIGACVAWTPNFHAVGLNYAKHAAESGMQPPAEPVLFSKATTSLSGPNDPVVQPKDSIKLDYEVELGIVIGAAAEYVSEADALSYVAGYCVINDISERVFQLERLGQWVKGKSAPGFGPSGPWLVTADEVGDPQTLGCWLEVNGQMRQKSNTSDMIFGVAEIVSYMSRFMRLVPGDLIATGTPEGVALGMKPPVWLKPGDEMRLGIDKLGEQRQRIVAYEG